MSMQTKRNAIGLDAPEFTETLSPAPTGDKKAIQDPFATSVGKVGALGAAALGFGGNLASIQPGPVKRA